MHILQVDVNDPEFWTKCVGLTVPDVREEKLGRYMFWRNEHHIAPRERGISAHTPMCALHSRISALDTRI